MSRTALELALRMEGVTSMILTNEAKTRAADGILLEEVGGSKTLFHYTRKKRVKRIVASFSPDLIHLHGGIGTALLSTTPAYDRPTVLSVHAWPRVPPLRELAKGSYRELRRSAVLGGRVFATTSMPKWVVRACLNTGKVKGILTFDPELGEELTKLSNVPVAIAESGANVDELQANHDQTQPTIVFAGRAETARGIDTLLDSFPSVRQQFPAAKLRLLLLPDSQLEDIVKKVDALSLRDFVEIQSSGVQDLRQEFAGATIAAFPFKYDFVTSGPPLTVIQAMSVGLPTIVTGVRCMTPLVKAGVVEVVPPNEPTALARSMRRILSDDSEWSRLSSAGRSLVANKWNWAAATQTTKRLYDEILG